MKNRNIIFLLIFIFLLVYGNFLIQENKQVKYYDIYLNISQNSNITINGDDFFFEIPPGKGISGNINVINNENRTQEVAISVIGDKNKFLTIRENEFILLSKEEKQVALQLFVPQGIFGNYFFRIEVESK